MQLLLKKIEPEMHANGHLTERRSLLFTGPVAINPLSTESLYGMNILAGQLPGTKSNWFTNMS